MRHGTSANCFGMSPEFASRVTMIVHTSQDSLKDEEVGRCITNNHMNTDSGVTDTRSLCDLDGAEAGVYLKEACKPIEDTYSSIDNQPIELLDLQATLLRMRCTKVQLCRNVAEYIASCYVDMRKKFKDPKDYIVLQKRPDARLIQQAVDLSAALCKLSGEKIISRLHVDDAFDIFETTFASEIEYREPRISDVIYRRIVALFNNDEVLDLSFIKQSLSFFHHDINKCIDEYAHLDVFRFVNGGRCLQICK